MKFTDYSGPGRPFRGSTDWAAAQIERLLEEEERRRLAWIGQLILLTPATWRRGLLGA